MTPSWSIYVACVVITRDPFLYRYELDAIEKFLASLRLQLMTCKHCSNMNNRYISPLQGKHNTDHKELFHLGLFLGLLIGYPIILLIQLQLIIIRIAWNLPTPDLQNGISHDDVIKWKHFPRYWPFVRGIYRSPVNSPAQRPVLRSFDVFFDLRLNKRLSKQSWGWWFETPSRSLWHHCNGDFQSNGMLV